MFDVAKPRLARPGCLYDCTTSHRVEQPCTEFTLLSIVLTSVYRYYKYCLYRHCSPKDQQMERRDRDGISTLMKRMQLFWKELFVIIQIQMELQQKTVLLKHFPNEYLKLLWSLDIWLVNIFNFEQIDGWWW